MPARTALGSDSPAPDSPGRRVVARCLRQVCARIRARCNRSTRYRWPFSNQQIVSLVFSCDGVGVGRVEKCELDFYRAVKEVLRNSAPRSEEHTSELQSRFELVCRLLLEKNNTK